jgi:hypothetical protein
VIVKSAPGPLALADAGGDGGTTENMTSAAVRVHALSNGIGSCRSYAKRSQAGTVAVPVKGRGHRAKERSKETRGKAKGKKPQEKVRNA